MAWVEEGVESEVVGEIEKVLVEEREEVLMVFGVFVVVGLRKRVEERVEGAISMWWLWWWWLRSEW